MNQEEQGRFKLKSFEDLSIKKLDSRREFQSGGKSIRSISMRETPFFTSVDTINYQFKTISGLTYEEEQDSDLTSGGSSLKSGTAACDIFQKSGSEKESSGQSQRKMTGKYRQWLKHKESIKGKLEFWTNLFYHNEKAESFFLFNLDKRENSFKGISNRILSYCSLKKIKKKKMSTVIEFIIKEIFEDDWYTEKGKIFMNFAENMISNKQFVLEELKFPTDNYCADPPQKSLEFIKNKIFKKWNKDKRLKKQKRLSLNIRKSGVKKRAVRKKSNSI